jgi:Amt family ammonium transporter
LRPPLSALIIGAAAGVICFLACTTLKAKLRYDDSLDAFGVSGVGGTLGVILTGVFATRAATDAARGQPLGLLEGGAVWKGQLIALAAAWLLAAVATFIILKALDATLGLRVSQQEEIQGLDVSQHGEEGYIFV